MSYYSSFDILYNSENSLNNFCILIKVVKINSDPSYSKESRNYRVYVLRVNKIDWFIGTDCAQSTNERVNTWHLYRYKKNKINRGRNSHSMLHQRVDHTLGTNRSRTSQPPVACASLKRSLFAEYDWLEFTHLHYITVPFHNSLRYINNWIISLILLKYYISVNRTIYYT